MDTYYDITSRNYDELHGEEQRKKNGFILNYVKIPKDSLVLDVGCGSGISSEIVKSSKVIGIDPSIELLKLAKENVICAYAEDIPFKDKTFDIVISLTAIQNFSDIKKSLEEIRRVGNDFFILTILKRSAKLNETRKLIKQIFLKYEIEELEEEKDIVFIIKRRFSL